MKIEGDFAFVHGSQTGINMTELHVAPAPAPAPTLSNQQIPAAS
jgi:hypothetical protein